MRARREDAVALVRRRLCLPAERDADVGAALGDRLVLDADGDWSAGPKRHVAGGAMMEPEEPARSRRRARRARHPRIAF